VDASGPLDAIDLYDADGYVDAPPWPAFARLRREDPVHWQPLEGSSGGGYWAVMKHADVVAVSRDIGTFSSERGSIVIEDLPEETLAMMRHMLLVMDPPRHGKYRRLVLHAFTPSMVDRLAPRIRAITLGIMERAAAARDVEFVHDVCSELPTQVIGELFGVPADDRAQLHAWAERNSGSQDQEIDPGEAGDSSTVQMASYAIRLAQERRGREGTDLTSVIVNSELEGHRMDDFEFGAFFVQLVTAGNDATRTPLSNGMLALLEHPEELARLWAEPLRLPDAIEEMLRWSSPLHDFRCTATRDVTLRGRTIREGEKVVMMYTSANRDEEVFEGADRFDVARRPNPHLAFGFGEHFCLGAKLARLEARVFFEELLARFPRLELTGKPRRQRSNLNNALKALPIRMTA
jgi:cytochrome P450